MSAPLLDPPTPVDTPAQKARTGLRRLSFGLFFGLVALFVPLTGTSVVLLPARLAELVPENKISALAILTACAAAASFAAAITFGAISDRTRSRLGRRNLWVLIGIAITALATALLAAAEGMVLLSAAFALQVVGANISLGALAPIVPDRVPEEARGRVSTSIGLGTLIGATVGIATASALLEDGAAPFLALAGLSLALGVAFQLLAPDFSNKADARTRTKFSPLSALAFPRNAPDFWWAFAGRLGVMLGYYVISGYQLYILTDYLDLDASEAAHILSTAALVNLVGALIGAALGGPVSDFLGRRKAVTMVSAGFIAAGVLLPLLIPTPVGFLAYMGVAGIGLGMFLSVDSALLSQVLPSSESHGKDLGILGLATNAGQFIGPLVGSAVVANVGFSAAFVAGSAVALIGALLLLPIRSVR